MDIRKAKKLIKGDRVRTKNSVKKLTVASIKIIPKAEGQIEDLVMIACTNGKEYPHKQLQCIPKEL